MFHSAMGGSDSVELQLARLNIMPTRKYFKILIKILIPKLNALQLCHILSSQSPVFNCLTWDAYPFLNNDESCLQDL